MSKHKRTLSPKAAGEAAELAFMARAASLGLTVSKPLGESASYDVVLGSSDRLLRIQVKSVAAPDGNRYSVTAARGLSKRPYTPAEIDFLVIFISPLDTWYIIPVDALAARIRLHLRPNRSASCRFEQFRERWDLLKHVSKCAVKPRSGARQ